MTQQGPKYLMLYSTTDGHTKTIIETMAKQLTDENGARCDVADIKDGGRYPLSQYQKVLLGASIRYGYFSSAFHEYVAKHQGELNAMPSAFFGVNLTARKEGKNTAMTNAYTRKFLTQSPWQPQLSGVFAGALWYPRYNYFDRVLIQFIMKVTGGETDPAKEIVYTDWAVVRRFASDFAALPLTVPPRPPTPEQRRGKWASGGAVQWALALAGVSAAVLFGRRMISSKRE
uniref:Protoporphyrinogen oxidase n=1 Tax=Zelonia costaricensis TaxID=372075 RepID=G1C9P4_9TRYP|nr:protoporphyrinogen oxidase [Zelonia costaricensis]